MGRLAVVLSPEHEQLRGPVILKKRFGEVFAGIVIDQSLLFFWVQEEILLDMERQIVTFNGPFCGVMAVQITDKAAWKVVVSEVEWAGRVRIEHEMRELEAEALELWWHEAHEARDYRLREAIADKRQALSALDRRKRGVVSGDAHGWAIGIRQVLAAQVKVWRRANK